MSAPPPDPAWVDRTIELAERGRYGVAPNPMVGAVVVRDGRAVAEGFHRRAGEAHAEIEALAVAGGRARGADLYVSLEPCVHSGRTPPCVPAILAAGIRRVVAASGDPNPLVRGRGFSALSRAGVEVLRGEATQRRRAERQNEKFRTWMAEGRPFVLAKWASTLDGRIADRRGKSRWITGREARRRALLLREEYDAVLVGAGTVAADDPRLTRRLGLAGGRPHRRIVLDGKLDVPISAQLFREPAGAVVVTASAAQSRAARRLRNRGVEVWSLPGRRSGSVSLARLMARLAEEQITSLMVEGGAQTLWRFFEAGLVDRVAVFLAPRVLGGVRAPGAVGGDGLALASAVALDELATEPCGNDLMVTARVLRRARSRR